MDVSKAALNFKEKAPDNNNYKTLCNIILHAANINIPRERIHNYKPSWSHELSNLKEDRDNARVKAETTGDLEDVIIWKQKAALLRKELSFSKKQVFRKYLENLDYRKDGNKIYKFINNLNRNNDHQKKKEPMATTKKELYKDIQIATEFTKYYTKSKPLSQEQKHKQQHIKHLLKQKFNKENRIKEFSSNFSMQELEQAITSLKHKKQPGPDKILTEFIQQLGMEAKKICLQLFNQIWITEVPSMWKKSIIVPILNNKQGIQLLSYISHKYLCQNNGKNG